MSSPAYDFPRADAAVQVLARIVYVAVFALSIIPSVILSAAYHAIRDMWDVCEEYLETSR